MCAMCACVCVTACPGGLRKKPHQEVFKEKKTLKLAKTLLKMPPLFLELLLRRLLYFEVHAPVLWFTLSPQPIKSRRFNIIFP